MAVVIPIVSTFDAKGVDKAVRDIEKAEGGWKKAGAGFKALEGPALAVGAGLAAGAAVSVKAASDLGETFNAVGKTFGTASDQITSYGETAAETMGLSQRAFQEMATNTGALLTNMGYDQDAAAASTINLAERAADMASVFNTDVDTALMAINAGLRGESEPLRAFGVGLSDAALKAKAMEMGIYDGVGALDASTKALATEALVLEQTDKYAGDFADTSDSMANKQRTLAAKTEDLAAAFGEALLPYVEDALKLFESLMDWVKQNQTAVENIIKVIAIFTGVILAVNVAMRAYEAAMKLAKLAQLAWSGAVAVARGVVMAYTAVQWALNAAMTANPIGLVVAAIALLIGAFVLAYQKVDWFRKGVQTLFGWLKTAAVAYINIYVAAFRKIADWMQTVWDWAIRLKDAIRNAFSFKPPSWISSIGGIFGRSMSAYSAPVGVSSYAAAPAARATSSGPVTINVSGAGSPYETAKAVKRALEGYDRGQGRTPWTPLAVSW